MSDLEKIKKDYGEKMSHFCRDNFSSILEADGLLYDIISSHFAPNKYLYEDLEYNYDEFKNYIYCFLNRDIEEVEVDKSPKELLDEVGYVLYECNSEDDIQTFKKYYAVGEELCTFNGGRLDKCYVFFAVKKDVDSIRREDYKKPKRQDKYGTSVISIQFSRGNVNTLSIKNRYNHVVDNPDATFSNDLENIVAGLTKSFEHEYNLCINSNINSFSIPGYVLANDKIFYKYNYEINNIHYCPNNIIIDNGKVITDYMQYERYIILDYFVLDLQQKKFTLYDKSLDESFTKRFNDIEKIDVIKDKKNECKFINIKTTEGNAMIAISDKNIMGIYEDDIEKDVENCFLKYSRYIEVVNMPNVKIIKNNFMGNDRALVEINLPSVVEIGDYFIYSNETMESISLPNVKKVGECFLFKNICLKEFNLPSLEEIKDNFLDSNECICFGYLPSVKKIGDSFMLRNGIMTEFRAPEVISIGNLFLRNCTDIKELYLNKVVSVGNYFLERASELKDIHMENVKKIGDKAFMNNNAATEIILPKVEEIGVCFLRFNFILNKVVMPNVKEIGNDFMPFNEKIEELEIPEDVNVGEKFLDKHPKFNHKKIKTL